MWEKSCQEWKEALSQLPVCGKDDGKLSRRLGGFWLRLGKRAPCIGAGMGMVGKGLQVATCRGFPAVWKWAIRFQFRYHFL